MEQGTAHTANPRIEAVLADLARCDPDVLLAVQDVDRSLIRLALEMSPLERVRSACIEAQYLSRFRRVER